MFDEAIKSPQSLLRNYLWIPELAGILPLSALIDFINVLLKLYIFDTGGNNTYNIVSVSDSSTKLNAKGVNFGKTITLVNIHGPWKLMRLDGVPGQADDTRGKSAEDWCDIAKEVFQEGLKLFEAATESTWLNQSDSYRESYVEMFEKYGRKKPVYE
ncbi:hypothetical protein BDV95DRAFT_604553 [Massariosphaeria phaeospora]|uniref:Uncharacterized protein n=1 Tax=Massariosphaeria phaeospora TaxID=100035 RepID=A0A7C8IC64_9PLEO|nr:hypothetical protein BDV95DRAFT_604553 [Massariosphaeria phaeospora]